MAGGALTVRKATAASTVTPQAEDMEWLGFRPKSRVYRTVTHQQTKNGAERGHGPEQWGGTNAYAVNQSGLLLGSLHT